MSKLYIHTVIKYNKSLLPYQSISVYRTYVVFFTNFWYFWSEINRWV